MMLLSNTMTLRKIKLDTELLNISIDGITNKKNLPKDANFTIFVTGKDTIESTIWIKKETKIPKKTTKSLTQANFFSE
jgi:hypothetical protein